MEPKIARQGGQAHFYGPLPAIGMGIGEVGARGGEVGVRAKLGVVIILSCRREGPLGSAYFPFTMVRGRKNGQYGCNTVIEAEALSKPPAIRNPQTTIIHA